jgi:hypothetical protein
MPAKSLSERIADFCLMWGYTEHEFCTRAGFPPSYLMQLRGGNAPSEGDLARLKQFMLGGLARHGQAARRKADNDAREAALPPAPERPHRRPIADTATPDERQFIWLIEEFANRWNYTDSDFGREAMGDPNFVQELRNPDGRSPTLRTVSKVKAWMERREMQLSAASQDREREPAAA